MIPKDQPDQTQGSLSVEQREPESRTGNRVIVKLKTPPDGSTVSVARSVEAAIPGGVLVRSPSATGRAVFAVAPDADLTQLAKDLELRGDVEYAEPDVVLTIQGVPNDSRYQQQWALPKVNAPAAWDITTGDSSDVLLGVVDSGISMDVSGTLDHPDLRDPTRYILGTDFVDDDRTPRDLNGHGTHVTGIAAAMTDNTEGVSGMTWATPVYVCRVFDADGNAYMSDVADAFEEIVNYAVERKLKAVINFSGGGPRQSNALHDACRYAHDRGMVVCAAAGNFNPDDPKKQVAVKFPAAYSAVFASVVAVGSTDTNDNVSDFSCVGPELSVVAPGSKILSTTPTYATGKGWAVNYDEASGTSMAAPHVAGLCALIWSRHPSLTNSQIRDRLQATAVKLGPGNFDNRWGYGRVDAERAVQ